MCDIIQQLFTLKISFKACLLPLSSSDISPGELAQSQAILISLNYTSGSKDSTLSFPEQSPLTQDAAPSTLPSLGAPSPAGRLGTSASALCSEVSNPLYLLVVYFLEEMWTTLPLSTTVLRYQKKV